MLKETRKIIKIASVYAGAVLGAGFASGQELTTFFVKFGIRGLIACAISGCLFMIFGAMVLLEAKKNKQTHYLGYLNSILGEKTGTVLYIVSEIFMAVSFCVMLSGSGALFKEQFNLHASVGILLTSAICFAVLQGNIKGLTTINMMLVPFMIIGMVLVCVVFIFNQYQESWLIILNEKNRAYGNIFLYVSFNMLTATAVLVPLSKIAEKKSSLATGGVLGGGVLLICAVFACSVLYIAYGSIAEKELPLLAVSQEVAVAASYTYAAVLYMALLTTAVANGFSVVEHFASKGRNRKIVALVLCIVSIPMSLIPFSNLIECCYTLFGVMGLVVLAGMLTSWFRN